jgi:CMP-N-acetylneuraminic acid synthetase
MKILIPYRLNSSRCKRKNIKEFHNGKSMLDLTIEQFKGHDIILASVPCDEASQIAQRHGAKQVALNQDEPEGWAGVVVDMALKAQECIKNPDEPILCWFATEITYFCNHTAEEFISHGLEAFKQGFDSTILCRPFKHFLLNDDFRPENFGWGSWFPWSQDIRKKYWVIPGLGMTSISTILKYRSINGAYYKPFIAHPLYVDIDEQFEFELAQTMWRTFKGEKDAST